MIATDGWDNIKLSPHRGGAQCRHPLLQTQKNICLFCSFHFPEQNICEMFVLVSK